MSEMETNLPEVVAEVRDLFERYEQALLERDVDMLDASFWESPHTVRYGRNEICHGFDEIHAVRVASGPLQRPRERLRLEILTLGHDLACVNLEYKGADLTQIG